MTRLILELSVETGIGPRELERLDHDELTTLIDVMNERAREARKANR